MATGQMYDTVVVECRGQDIVTDIKRDSYRENGPRDRNLYATFKKILISSIYCFLSNITIW